MNLIERLQSLINAANKTTKQEATNMTDATRTLIDGYGSEGSGLSYVAQPIPHMAGPGEWIIGEINELEQY